MFLECLLDWAESMVQAQQTMSKLSLELYVSHAIPQNQAIVEAHYGEGC